MSLAADYCKEIAKQLGQTAIYLPGSSVKVGDIIAFKDTTIFGKPKPLGEFSVRGNLTDFGIVLESETEHDNSKDSYVYASKGSVSISFEASANGADLAQGALKIGFSKEGSTYLSAVDCKETRFKTVVKLEESLAKVKDQFDWDKHFIVISVTVADKALIMQSNSSNASLEISGQVKNLTPGNVIVKDLDAGIDLKITKYNEASFLKDWSSNVPVFFTLVRYHKKFLGSWNIENKMTTFAQQLSLDKDTKEQEYIIDLVDPSELL